MITNNLYGTFAFDENGIYHNTALLAILNNEQLRTWSGAVTGLETFGGTHRITKSNHDYIAEIEQQPAVQWFQKMLRELRHAKDDGLSEDLLLHFPLRLQKPGNPGQFIHYCEPRDRIETYSNWLPPGTEFQMAYLSPMTAAAELQKQCSELETTPCEVIFAYPGTLHRTAMQNCTEWGTACLSQLPHLRRIPLRRNQQSGTAQPGICGCEHAVRTLRIQPRISSH